MARHQLFDDNVMTLDAYRYDGVKGGSKWKTQVEKYFMGTAAVLKEILGWAEVEPDAISEASSSMPSA